MQVLSVRVGKVRTHESPQGEWTSATFKDAVHGPVRIHALGLEGDEQADLKVHGGEKKAILFYSASHYPKWQEELGREDFSLGALGENICLDEGLETDVCLGDRYRLGTAIVEVSQIRRPCWKQARRWDIHDLALQITRNGRSGWYTRVIEPGVVAVGDQMTLLSRPNPDQPLRVQE